MSGLLLRVQATASISDPSAGALQGCSGCWAVLPRPPLPASQMGGLAQSWEANPSPRVQSSRACSFSSLCPLPEPFCP